MWSQPCFNGNIGIGHAELKIKRSSGKKVVLTKAKMWEKVECVGRYGPQCFGFLQARPGLSSRNISQY